MPHRHVRAGIFGILLGFLFSLGAASAQSIPPEDQAALAATWHGSWTADDFIYDAELHFAPGASNALDGSIRWTLRRSPRANEQNKIGLTGIEYVKGAYQTGGRVLTFEGYRKDDPNGILGLDKYRLILSENDAVLGGITWHHGPWTGQFFLKR